MACQSNCIYMKYTSVFKLIFRTHTIDDKFSIQQILIIHTINVIQILINLLSFTSMINECTSAWNTQEFLSQKESL